MPILLRQFRKRAGMTQTDLARQLRKARSLISQYETGNIEPPLSVLMELADIFHCSLDALCPPGTEVVRPERPRRPYRPKEKSHT